jgi:hypothetical protein
MNRGSSVSATPFLLLLAALGGAVILRRQSRQADEEDARAAALRRRLDRYVDECEKSECGPDGLPLSYSG